ncbi:MAG: SCP2 sterol-binding domain-containing protein, partial [Gemmatimonadaceae bacterium]
MPHAPFSQSWADALREILNADAGYHDASKNWRWLLALAMDAEPALGFPEAVAVELDLVNGRCERAEARPAVAVRADYVLRGDLATWKSIVRDDVDAVSAVMTGTLKLAKGSLFSLMSHVSSARALVACARRVDTRFPDEPLPSAGDQRTGLRTTPCHLPPDPCSLHPACPVEWPRCPEGRWK